jgi:hypothetical protein
MNTDTPRDVMWYLALALGLLGIVASFVSVPGISPHAFWLVVLGFVLMVIAPLFRGISAS